MAAKRFDETRELCLSWGPCQFATLGFIVDRAWKIESHVVEEFYRLVCPPPHLCMIKLDRAQPSPSNSRPRLRPVGGAAQQDLFHIMYLLISFKKSTPPQNRQINILMSNSKQ